MAKEESEEETESPKKKSNLVPAIVIMVGLLGGGFLMKPSAPAATATDGASGSTTLAPGKVDPNAYAEELGKTCPDMSHFLENWKTTTKKAFVKADQIAQVDLGESTFTLADYSYAKISVSVGLTKKAKLEGFVKEEGAEARDVVRKVLSTKSAADLSGAAFEHVLCEISGEAAKEYGDKVYRVFITSMVVQPSGRPAPATTAPVVEETTTTTASEHGEDETTDVASEDSHEESGSTH